MKINIPDSSNYNPLLAMELVNLVERAYQQFDHGQKRISALKNGENLPSWRESLQHQITGSTVAKPELREIAPEIHELDHPANPGQVTYKLLATFNYTGYWIGKPGKVSFGFIAERTLEDGTSGIFVVFRGTRTEPEWVSNSQYAQIPFLKNVIDQANLGLVSRGYNKIYTRPDANEIEEMHRTFSDVDIFAGSIRDSILDTLSNCPSNAQIFVTGHSLGGALATLAACDIQRHTEFHHPILYTFASPRVGDSAFAKLFEDLSCFRIANSEDVVPTVPPPSSRLIGEEMFESLTPARRGTLEFLLKTGRQVTDAILNTEWLYEHVGEPLYFTAQKGSISLNHNMLYTYRDALP